MRFQVPQFTDIQTKLIGPFTLRQFLWLAGGGLVFVLAQFFLEGTALIILTAVIAAAAIAMAYIKIGNVTLPQYILLALLYLLNPKKYRYTSDANDKQG